MEQKIKCLTSKQSIVNGPGRVIFPCPNCDYEIVRSVECRKRGARYTCPKCGFTGPN